MTADIKRGGGGGGGGCFIADFFPLRSNFIIARFRYTGRYKTACTLDIGKLIYQMHAESI